MWITTQNKNSMNTIQNENLETVSSRDSAIEQVQLFEPHSLMTVLKPICKLSYLIEPDGQHWKV